MVLCLVGTPVDLPGTHFTELVWEHRPHGPAAATLGTGRDVFVHRRACQGDEMDPRLPTLQALLESRGVEIAEGPGPTTRPRLLMSGAVVDDPDAFRVVVAPNGLWLSGADRRLGGLVRLIDVSATVLDLFGMIDLGWEHGLQGQSVLDLSDDTGTCRECYLTDCERRGWRTREGELWEPDLPEELTARVRGYVRRRVAETGLVDPLIRLGPESPNR